MIQTPIHNKRRFVTNYCALIFNAYSDSAIQPQPGWDTHRITLAKYPLDNLGKQTKVT